MFGLAAIAAGEAQGADSPPGLAFAQGEGFELYKRVRTSNCPAEFRQVWDADYDRLQRIIDIYAAATAQYETERAKLLADKVWWGSPAYSDAALAGTDALNGIKMATDLYLNLTELTPAGAAAGGVAKVVRRGYSSYEFINKASDGKNAEAIYEGMGAIDVIPPGVTPTSDLLMQFFSWNETRQDFAAYRVELRAALERFDRGIADANGKLRAAQEAFRAKTERGLGEFCNELPTLVAADDQALLDFRRHPEVCIPVLTNDLNPTAESVEIVQVGAENRPAGQASVGPGGACVRYRPPDGMPIPFNDSLDYEIRDSRGRRARATLRVHVTQCELDPLGHGGSDLDYCGRSSPSPLVTAPPRPPPMVTIAPPTRPPLPAGYCEPGLIEIDGSCWTPDKASSFLKSKCDPEYGWGNCTADQRRLAEANGNGPLGVTPTVEQRNAENEAILVKSEVEGKQCHWEGPLNERHMICDEGSRPASNGEGAGGGPGAADNSQTSGGEIVVQTCRMIDEAKGQNPDNFVCVDESVTVGGPKSTDRQVSSLERAGIGADGIGGTGGAGTVSTYDPYGPASQGSVAPSADDSTSGSGSDSAKVSNTASPPGPFVSVPADSNRSTSPFSVVRDGDCRPSAVPGWVDCYERKEGDAAADPPQRRDALEALTDIYDEVSATATADIQAARSQTASIDAAVSELPPDTGPTAAAVVGSALAPAARTAINMKLNQMLAQAAAKSGQATAGGYGCDPETEDAVASRLQQCQGQAEAASGICQTTRSAAACLAGC
jgi:hypothetical protein